MILPYFNRLSFTSANRQLSTVLLVGLALGFANYALGVYNTLGRSIVLQVLISFLIGYTLLVLVDNLPWARQAEWTTTGYLTLIGASFLLGVLATEGQLAADYLLFGGKDYAPGRAGGVYLFNGILATVLGFMSVRWFQANVPTQVTEPDPIPPAKPLTKIPLRKGEETVLIALADVRYFEAYDNYAFLHHRDGSRSLCNYSLGYLEERLAETFLRVHRKYLINTAEIVSIVPHLKGRFVLTLGESNAQTIRSSATYAEAVRELMKL